MKHRPGYVLVACLALMASGCVIPDPARQTNARTAPAMPQPAATSAPAAIPAPAPPPMPAEPAGFVVEGELTQGGWIRGEVPAGTVSATLDEETLTLDRDGTFFAAFDRDSGPTATLTAQLGDGRQIVRPLAISPRDWDIEHVNVARRAGVPSESFMARRRPELERIGSARAVTTGSEGWRQDFAWPAQGRISGRFGSQRVYRGEPGSYHTGLDIATGESGTPFVAPADGVVVLAAGEPFTLEGHLIIIDHGMGLNSAFLHASEISVREGERVRQGQVIGRIGASGRATGPHLHWSIKWRDARLDPLLFLGPQGA